jgi:hypothetical protein
MKTARKRQRKDREREDIAAEHYDESFRRLHSCLLVTRKINASLESQVEEMENNEQKHLKEIGELREAIIGLEEKARIEAVGSSVVQSGDRDSTTTVVIRPCFDFVSRRFIALQATRMDPELSRSDQARENDLDV